MDADQLANRVAHEMLAAEGTGPAWGIRIEEARSGYARASNGAAQGHAQWPSHRAWRNGVRACRHGLRLCLQWENERTVAAQASIVFLDAAKEGEALIAEAEEVSRSGRSGVTRVAVRTEDGRPIAEFTGYSRTIGGAVVDI